MIICYQYKIVSYNGTDDKTIFAKNMVDLLNKVYIHNGAAYAICVWKIKS